MSSGAAPVIGFFFPIAVSIPTSSRPPPAGGEGAILFTASATSAASIYKVQPDGTGLTQVTTAPANTTDIAAWSPDGTRFAVVRQSNSFGGGASLLVVNADGSSPTTIWTGSGSAFPASQPSWTADGSQVVCCYEAVTGNSQGLGAAFVNANGSGHTLVPITVPSVRGGVGGVVDSVGFDSGMYLSPDGTTLAFSIDYASGNFQAFPATCPAAGGTATVMTAPVPAPGINTPNAWAQGWYADSRHLLGYGNGPSADRVFKIKSDGTGETAIYTVTATFEYGACLAPDETRIANADNNHGLLSIPIGGGTTSTIVAASPLQPAAPNWANQTVAGTIQATAAQYGIRPNQLSVIGNLL